MPYAFTIPAAALAGKGNIDLAAGDAPEQAFEAVRPFVSPMQLACLRDACAGEEGAYFKQAFIDLAQCIATMPATYEQDGLGDEAIVHLHYFLGGSDWYITEKDRDGGIEQAFGYAVLNGDEQMAECGYISIAELTHCGAELDLHFAPRSLATVKAERAGVVDEPHDEEGGTALSEDESVIPLAEFVSSFRDGLLQAVRSQNPAIYDGHPDPRRQALLGTLLRTPFPAQAEAIHAAARLLFDEDAPSAVMNGEMGCGKTLMGIALGYLAHHMGLPRTLVLAPPHLVYKWRREIKQTVPDARVWILNGPDTLKKLLALRGMLARPAVPEFFVMGRVRMRMGFDWTPVFDVRGCVVPGADGRTVQVARYAACMRCGTLLSDEDGEPIEPDQASALLAQRRQSCRHCGERLWSLTAKSQAKRSRRALLSEALEQIPTIGPKTAQQLLARFGEDMIGGMLEDNLYEFINLMDEHGELVFSDRQARRMERAMANMEFSFGQGGFQASEFIKRYLPHGYFGMLLADEAHEYKSEGSAQGQAMGVLARKCRKVVPLTGTLMGGYADDIFHLLWRIHPRMMMDDGFGYSTQRSLGPAQMAFMREHGVIKDIYSESSEPASSHRTAKGTRIVHHTAKGPGFGPKGIARFVLPITAFVKLKDLGGDALPPYEERLEEVAMSPVQQQAYARLERELTAQLRAALRKRDKSLLGVVLNALLAWPECAFRDERVRHPRTREQLAYQPALFGEGEAMPKEAWLIDKAREQKRRGRRLLAYTVYTGTRDTSVRLKRLLSEAGLKVAVLRAQVKPEKREDWVMEQVDRGIDVLVTNPELVKTGLDLYDFPAIAFMQSGYSVYTLQQAARRSWRIGQKQAVEVFFAGYAGSAQMRCLELMGKKVAVSQSTSGDMPESGLDILNQGGDSIEVALAKQIVS